jgi:hypothetical protein
MLSHAEDVALCGLVTSTGAGYGGTNSAHRTLEVHRMIPIVAMRGRNRILGDVGSNR